jgi:purine nucleosidase
VRCAIEVQNGMVTPSAEFNIWADPHAADIVFRCGRPIVALSLDVTHQVLVTRSVLARVQAIGNPVSLASYDMLSFFNRYDSNKYGSDGAPLHDACTMAYLLKPELFRTKTCSVVVEIHSPLTRGHTAVDFWHVTKNDKYVDWAYAVDTAGFFDLMIDRLGRYSV